MQKIFFSCFGTTDPVRGMRDGGMLHILRFYRPEAVYLFLSREIAELDRQISELKRPLPIFRRTGMAIVRR